MIFNTILYLYLYIIIYLMSNIVNIDNLYDQIKQRIDCEIIKGNNNILEFSFLTKIKYSLRKEINYNEIDFNSLISINLHCKNMKIKKIFIETDDCEYYTGIVYKHLEDESFQKELNSIEKHIRNESDFENYNRVLFERFNENGNLQIIFPSKYILNEQKPSSDSEIELSSIFKINILYNLNNLNNSIVYHKFYNEKFDYEYDIYYTPNYVS